jgi:hypothetical protein
MRACGRRVGSLARYRAAHAPEAWRSDGPFLIIGSKSAILERIVKIVITATTGKNRSRATWLSLGESIEFEDVRTRERPE